MMRIRSSRIPLYHSEVALRRRLRLVIVSSIVGLFAGGLGALAMVTQGRSIQYLTVPAAALGVMILVVLWLRHRRQHPDITLEGTSLKVGSETVDLTQTHFVSCIHTRTGANVLVSPPPLFIPATFTDLPELIRAAGWHEDLASLLDAHEKASSGSAGVRELYSLGLYEVALKKLQPPKTKEEIRIFYLISRNRLSPAGIVEAASVVHRLLPEWSLPLEDSLRIALALKIRGEADALFERLSTMDTEELTPELLSSWWKIHDSQVLAKPAGTSMISGLVSMGHRSMRIREDGSFRLQSGGHGHLRNYVAYRVSRSTTGPSELALFDVLGRLVVLDSDLDATIPAIRAYGPHIMELGDEGIMDFRTRNILNHLKKQ